MIGSRAWLIDIAIRLSHVAARSHRRNAGPTLGPHARMVNACAPRRAHTLEAHCSRSRTPAAAPSPFGGRSSRQRRDVAPEPASAPPSADRRDTGGHQPAGPADAPTAGGPEPGP